MRRGRPGTSGARGEGGGSPIALAAISWSLAFAAIHVAWALGSTAGLGGRRVTGMLLAIDVLAIPLCLLAAWIAWRLRDPGRARRAPPIVPPDGLGRRAGARAPRARDRPGADPANATALTRRVDRGATRSATSTPGYSTRWRTRSPTRR